MAEYVVYADHAAIVALPVPTLVTLKGGQLISDSDFVIPALIAAGFRMVALNVVASSDPWTYLKVAGADFTTDSATPVPITGLTFTPEPSTTYAVFGQIVASSTVAGVAPQVGVAWPTGLAGHGAFMALNSNTVSAITVGPIVTQGTAGGSTLAAVPTNADGYLMLVFATFTTGPAPAGDFAITLESEVAANAVAARLGSWVQHREV